MINVWGSPIFGIGLNEWVRPFFMRSGSIDNFWLVNAVRYGIPGFLFLILGYLPTLWWIGRRNFDADQRLWLLRRAWMFTFAGLTLTLCTVHVWTSIYSFVFFLFGAGMWFLTTQVSPNQQTAEPFEQPPRKLISNRSSLKRTLLADMKRSAEVPDRKPRETIAYSRFSGRDK
jgi:hypothetical protein